MPDGEWYLHLFAPEQPDWNWRDPRTSAFFDDVLRFWFDRGCDGVRIDVAHGLFKAPGLPDLSPADLAAARRRRACVRSRRRATRRRCTRSTGAGGRWPTRTTAAPRARRRGQPGPGPRARYTRPDELHQAFAFGFLTAPWDADLARVGAELLAARRRAAAP